MEITLTRPDDWHLHLRDGAALNDVVPHTARQFGRAIVMPNLKPPVTTTELALAYRDRILAAVPEGVDFQPLMTLYLTESTTPEEIDRAADSGAVFAVKLYPAGATTNSDAGIRDVTKASAVLERMQKRGMTFCVHGEVVDPEIDIYDREAVFIDRTMSQLAKDFPELKMVFEHLTTRDGAQFVAESADNIGATLTPQHLLYNRNAMLVGGVRPHFYCLPILKRETHREALVAAATSGSRKFFLGTDSAPHPQHAKETSCGCAGCYSAHAALELYAETFEQADALDKFEAFASFNGPDFYGLPRNTGTVTLRKEAWEVPASYAFGEDRVIPLRAGESIGWKQVD